MKLSIIFASILFLASSFAQEAHMQWESELNHAKSLFELREYQKAYEISAKVLNDSNEGTQQWVDSSYFVALAALHAGDEVEANKWFELHLNAYFVGLEEGNIDDVYFLWIDNLIYGFAAYYQNTGNFDNALKYHIARLNFFESYPSILKPEDRAWAHNNISVSLGSLKRFDEARKQLSIAIEYAKDKPDTLSYIKFQKLLLLSSEDKCEELQQEMNKDFAISLNKLKKIVLKFELCKCKKEVKEAVSLANETLKNYSQREIDGTLELLILKQYVEKKL